MKNVSDVCGGVALTEKDGVRIVPDEPCVIVRLCKGGKRMSDSRLFRILYDLLEKGHATAPELADKFEVSVRTIYRDVEALSGAGIPIYAEQGRNGEIGRASCRERVYPLV